MVVLETDTTRVFYFEVHDVALHASVNSWPSHETASARALSRTERDSVLSIPHFGKSGCTDVRIKTQHLSVFKSGT